VIGVTTKNVKIIVANDLAVVKNGETNSAVLNLSDCESFNIMITPSATHTWKADIQWDGVVTEALISSASQGVKLSSITNVKTPYAKIVITNLDVDNNRTYDIDIFKHV
jgi:hypothetical protein